MSELETLREALKQKQSVIEYLEGRVKMYEVIATWFGLKDLKELYETNERNISQEEES